MKIPLYHAPMFDLYRLNAFLGAQFLGALNDNALKMIVSLAAFDFFAAYQGQVSYLSAASAVFILPFMLCSMWAGRLMDGRSTATVLKVSKYAEIPIVMAGTLAYISGAADSLLLVVLFLMAAQSAVFSPAKYGFLPEVLPAEVLPRVNAIMLLSTYVAILGGTVLGATLYDWFSDSAIKLFLPLIIISLTGAAAIYGVGKTPVKPAIAPASIQATVKAAWQAISGEPRLRVSFYGQALFWFTGAFLYLVFLTAGNSLLLISVAASGYLFAFMAAGIIVGGFAAVVLARRLGFDVGLRHAAGLLSLGLLGTTLSLNTYTGLATSAFLTGVGGGLWMVPLVTIMQQNTDISHRGRVLALTSMHNMSWVLMASLLFWVGQGVLTLPLPYFTGGIVFVVLAVLLRIVLFSKNK